MTNYKIFLILSAFLVITLTLSCSDDQGIQPLGFKKAGYTENLQQSSPAAGKQIEGVKDATGNITGYFYSDNPSVIFPIGESKDVQLSSRSTSVTSVAGDMDNFGYGGTDNPPCVFYDLSEPVDDLGIFDRELESGDETDSWTQDFTANANYCAGMQVSSVTIKVREFFSDYTVLSTLSIDGNVIYFTPEMTSLCDAPVIQTFTFTGSAASFASDGIINFIFSENGDDIVIDWVSVTVEGNCNIIIDGCNSGILDQEVGGSSMMDLINECAENANNHGSFVSCVAHLTNEWKAEGLITGDEKEAIMDCAAGAQIP